MEASAPYLVEKVPAVEPLEEVETKALSIVDQAKAVKVIDKDSYIKAARLWVSIGEMIKEVKATFDPICEAAHRTHRAATEKRAMYLNPLEASQKSVKKIMSDYDIEQERIAQAEAARLAEIARKEEEERVLAEAILAEKEAISNGATKEEAAQEAQQIINDPIVAPRVVVEKETPKLAGGPVYREVWSAECFDIKALCKAVAEGRVSPECVLPNMPTLNKLAVGLKGTLSIPGVRPVSRRV